MIDTGDDLKHWRLSLPRREDGRRVTQVEAAARLAVNPRTYERWESADPPKGLAGLITLACAAVSAGTLFEPETGEFARDGKLATNGAARDRK